MHTEDNDGIASRDREDGNGKTKTRNSENLGSSTVVALLSGRWVFLATLSIEKKLR